MFLNTSIECLCVVKENLDQASSSIELFKKNNEKHILVPIFVCAHEYGHPKISLIKVFKISYCSWEQGLRIKLKSNIELYDNKI